jgi:acetyl esterase/lipase
MGPRTLALVAIIWLAAFVSPTHSSAEEDHREFRAKIAAISSPILILQGDDDTHSGLKPFSTAVLTPMLRAAGKSLDLIIHPGEPHASSFYSNPARTPRPAAAWKAFRDIDAFAGRFLQIQPVAIDPVLIRHEPVR